MMIFSTKNTLQIITVLTVTVFATGVNATPTVEGNVIKWTEDGWHQVQLQSTYESVCNGGSQCTVSAGVYTVINHGTGKRFMNIAVPTATSNNIDQPRAPIMSTGQNISYAAGDDGDYQLGVTAIGQRFQDIGDGTFDDSLTGLTWLAVRDCVPQHSWGVGVEYANNFSANSGDCPALSDGSQAGDWRMPNIKELMSLVNFSVAFPAWEPQIPFSGNWIADPISGSFWSSTSFQGYSPEANAYSFNSGVGLSQADNKTRSNYIMPVRNSQ